MGEAKERVRAREDVDSGARLWKKKVAMNVSSIFEDRYSAYMEDEVVPILEKERPGASYEEHMIIRFPQSIVADVRRALDDGSIGDSLTLTFHTERLGTLIFSNKAYKATIVDLPCIIETAKTQDDKQFYKVADIAQMVLVDDENPKVDVQAFYNQDYFKETLSFEYPHGLTPPLLYVRKRRFRKTPLDAPKRMEYIRSVEEKAFRLIQSDSEAIHSSFEVRDEDGALLVDELTIRDYDPNKIAGAEAESVELPGSSEDEDSDFVAEIENTLLG